MSSPSGLTQPSLMTSRRGLTSWPESAPPRQSTRTWSNLTVRCVSSARSWSTARTCERWSTSAVSSTPSMRSSQTRQRSATRTTPSGRSTRSMTPSRPRQRTRSTPCSATRCPSCARKSPGCGATWGRSTTTAGSWSPFRVLCRSTVPGSSTSPPCTRMRCRTRQRRSCCQPRRRPCLGRRRSTRPGTATCPACPATTAGRSPAR
mmetsp:Transcript_20399/g.61498  ORF Transcript_20399/g.61498 Transcript_20399/m.61498 type:complete len:205 (+) Transcript_20399:638-1252(+)